MRIGILGAAEASLNGAPVDLGTCKQRALLAALAMHRGRPVAPDAIVDLLWSDSPPTAVTATLQGYVARLRRALEPDRPPRAPSELLVTQQAETSTGTDRGSSPIKGVQQAPHACCAPLITNGLRP